MSRARSGPPRTPRLTGPTFGPPLACVGGGAVSAVLGLFAGRDGAVLGAAMATVVVLLFFWTGALPLLLVGGNTAAGGVGLIVLLTGYALRLFVVLVVLAVAAEAPAVDGRWLAGTLIALALVWSGAQVALLGRSRVTLDV